jgi:hypothetical protein
MRFPAKLARAVPNRKVIADETVDEQLFEITQVVNPRWRLQTRDCRRFIAVLCPEGLIIRVSSRPAR